MQAEARTVANRLPELKEILQALGYVAAQVGEPVIDALNLPHAFSESPLCDRRACATALRTRTVTVLGMARKGISTWAGVRA
jgi:hypothetical protein